MCLLLGTLSIQLVCRKLKGEFASSGGDGLEQQQQQQQRVEGSAEQGRYNGDGLKHPGFHVEASSGGHEPPAAIIGVLWLLAGDGISSQPGRKRWSKTICEA